MSAVDEPSPDTALAGPALGYVDSASRWPARTLMTAAHLDERLRSDPTPALDPVLRILWRALLTGLPNVVVPVEYLRTLDLGDARL